MHLAPTYTLLAQEGPDHDKTFEVAIFLGDKEYGRALGKSKKEAQQNAAARALAMLAAADAEAARATGQGPAGRAQLTTIAQEAMPEIDRRLIPEDVVAICRRLREAGHEAHLVGGGMRDLVLGREPKDFDLATSAIPDAVMALFGHRFAIPTGLQHGTVTVLSGPPPAGRPVEVTTFRGEGVYLDGRRPSSVEFGKTLIEDLSRRDFTMNAIAYDPLADG